MIKYEKPLLINLSKVGIAQGVCATGESNVERCINGDTVIPGCANGGIPTIGCDVGRTNT